MTAVGTRATGGLTREDILAWLEQVADPEIPVLSVVDLGIVRDITITPAGVEIAVAPTYSACPAMEAIEQGIVRELERHGVPSPRVKRVLSPPWTTDWLSESGRRKLSAYGIAPPAGAAGKRSLRGGDRPLACPRCGSRDATRVSEFGSTPCKASYKCNACLEPFEYFKCI
ncbi:MAG: 1,2-phenylacetyl-CoA epoxidase subunit PaaD [Planctomycetaceae bacterium]